MDAIILAGGKGSRLAPWPAPKCLLPVNGVSIIERLIMHIENDVERVIVCTGYRAGDVEAACTVRGGLIPAFSFAGEDVPMGVRLLRAREEHEVYGRVVILYGDELADVDVDTIESWHLAHKARITFAAHKQVLPFGVVRGTGIHGDEKVLVNIGFVVVEPDCWESLQKEDGLSDWINRCHGVRCFEHEGRRATINSLADLEYAERVWS